MNKNFAVVARHEETYTYRWNIREMPGCAPKRNQDAKSQSDFHLRVCALSERL
jgi:hypothetical protein